MRQYTCVVATTLIAIVASGGCDQTDGFRRFEVDSPVSDWGATLAVTPAEPATLDFGFLCPKNPEDRDDSGPTVVLVMVTDSTLEKELLEAGLREDQEPYVTVEIGGESVGSDWFWNRHGNRLMGLKSVSSPEVVNRIVAGDTVGIRLESRRSNLVIGDWTVVPREAEQALRGLNCTADQEANDG